MAQPQFIFRIGQRSPRFGQWATLPVQYARKTKVTGRTNVGGFCFQNTKDLGIDKGRIQVHPPKMQETTTVPATAEGVKSACRRIREQEAAELDAIDAEIDALNEKAIELRRRRRDAVRKAFNNGNVVRLTEIIARCDERATPAKDAD